MVDPDGEQLGVLSIQEARQEAEKRGLDLIEVAPQADPPVCRIIDYGKFRYDQQKKAKEGRKKSKQIEIKDIRVRPNTDEHDIAFKLRNARKFLTKGHKVKFNVIFRGPELRHKEIGEAQLQRFIDGSTDVGEVDQPPRMEGRRMTMILGRLNLSRRAKSAITELIARRPGPGLGSVAFCRLKGCRLWLRTR